MGARARKATFDADNVETGQQEIRVDSGFFASTEQASAWFRHQDLHEMAFDVPPVDNQAHWHVFSSILYITHGELRITDVACKRVLTAGPGDRVVVPARVLHQEQSGSGYRVLAGLSLPPEQLQAPIDREPALLEG